MPFIWRNVVPEKWFTLILSDRLHEEKPDPFIRTYNFFLALTELTRQGEPKCLFLERLAQLEG